MSSQVGGTHYSDMDLEPIDVARAWMTQEELRGYYWGTAIKYLGRWKNKGGAEDLRKAKHFMEWLIEHEEAS